VCLFVSAFSHVGFCLHVLCSATHRSFHLRNGASVHRLNWLGDLSSKGMAQSCGLMVNYMYALDALELNHQAYAEEFRIEAAPAVTTLL
jgi:malonyl-CoA decarboxylase